MSVVPGSKIDTMEMVVGHGLPRYSFRPWLIRTRIAPSADGTSRGHWYASPAFARGLHWEIDGDQIHLKQSQCFSAPSSDIRGKHADTHLYRGARRCKGDPKATAHLAPQSPICRQGLLCSRQLATPQACVARVGGRGWQRHFFLLINPNPRDVMGLKWPHVQQLLSSPQFPSYTYIHLAALIAILAFILFLIVASRSLSRAQLLQHLRVPACRKRGGKSGMAPA